MSDNAELKDLAKKLMHIGLEVGKPVARKVLESETGKTLMNVGAGLAVDIMAAVTEKMAKPKPWDLIEEIEEMSKELELRKKDPTLAEKLSKVPGEEKNETK